MQSSEKGSKTIKPSIQIPNFKSQIPKSQVETQGEIQKALFQKLNSEYTGKFQTENVDEQGESQLPTPNSQLKKFYLLRSILC